MLVYSSVTSSLSRFLAMSLYPIISTRKPQLMKRLSNHLFVVDWIKTKNQRAQLNCTTYLTLNAHQQSCSVTLHLASVSANQTGSSPKKKHPFMARLLTRHKISLKLAKFMTGSPCKARSFHLLPWFYTVDF